MESARLSLDRRRKVAVLCYTALIMDVSPKVTAATAAAAFGTLIAVLLQAFVPHLTVDQDLALAGAVTTILVFVAGYIVPHVAPPPTS